MMRLCEGGYFPRHTEKPPLCEGGYFPRHTVPQSPREGITDEASPHSSSQPTFRGKKPGSRQTYYLKSQIIELEGH